jgi:hypothetical protein
VWATAVDVASITIGTCDVVLGDATPKFPPKV